MEGYTLKAARVNARMTQQELAEKLGVSRHSLSMWETGKAKVSKRTLLAISAATGCDVEDFILPEEVTKRKQEEAVCI